LGNIRLICISTSLIEAGVDVSFDCVIRSLAGLDSIAQAAGRCNRNGSMKLGIVYIIRSKDEDISRLPEIDMAQKAIQPILAKYEEDPEFFSSDLLSPGALESYYKRYFKQIENEMNYKLPDKNTNLFDLLSMNETGISAYYTNQQEMPKLLMNQAFKTAGNDFEVIINHSTGVVVPYNEEAKELISKLNSRTPLEDMKKTLKLIQRYTVNLFQHEVKKLDKVGGIYRIEDLDIFVLVDGFYSEKVGVTLEANMEFMSI